MCSTSYAVEVVSAYDQFSLKYLMDKRKKYSRKRFVQYFREGEIWDIMTQILRGCNAAKERGIIYDDIQPHNIMLQDKSGAGAVGIDEEAKYRVRLLNPRYFRKAR